MNFVMANHKFSEKVIFIGCGDDCPIQ